MPVKDAPLTADVPLGLLVGENRITDASGGEHQHIYPATGKPTVQVPLAGAVEVDLAVAAARRALPAWRSMPRDQRRARLMRLAALIRENGDELARLATLENGTPALVTAHAPSF